MSGIALIPRKETLVPQPSGKFRVKIHSIHVGDMTKTKSIKSKIVKWDKLDLQLIHELV